MINKTWIAGTVLAAVLGAGLTSLADERSREADNPYLQLYRLRVSQAEANVARRDALADLAAKRYDRAVQLFQRNAMSREEYETAHAESKAAAAELQLASQKVDEAKAYLKIIDGLVARGVDIPLCTYEME